MPYIITSKQLDSHTDERGNVPEVVVSRRAVATLAEARGATEDVPDGTVIKVERVDWLTIDPELPVGITKPKAETQRRALRAYNVAQD